MSSTYTGIPGNVSLASAVQETIPADGDALAVTSVNVALQKLADYIEALRLGAGGVFAEGFESATFPPTATSKWATPSSRFGSDSAWVRTTTNPIAGTASASAPVPQTLSTNSSLGLDIFFTSPSRISFLFAVNCILNNGDHLDFYVDGTLTAQFSTQVSNTLVGGKFVTDLLREGAHNFDWRFVRGGSASVAAEECKIDTVEIIPEEVWRGDPTRFHWFEECFSESGTMTANTQIRKYPFVLNTGTNAATWSNASIGGGVRSLGVFHISVPSVAVGDWGSMISQLFNVQPQTASAFLEMRVCADGVGNANAVDEWGWGTGIAIGASDNAITWAYDGSLSTTNLRWRGIVAGTATNLDSGIVITVSTFIRLGIITATVRGVTSAVFTKDGKALPGAASIPPLMATGIPTSAALSPSMRVRSITGTLGAGGDVDWFRCLMLR